MIQDPPTANASSNEVYNILMMKMMLMSPSSAHIQPQSDRPGLSQELDVIFEFVMSDDMKLSWMLGIKSELEDQE